MGAIQVKGTRNIVMYYLETCENLRDNDEKLIASIWNIELRRNNIDSKNISGFAFLKHFADGNLTNPESIRRSRAMIQASLPELRGKSYKDRQNKSNDVKDDLDTFFDDAENNEPTED
jgi:hypothetical protein